MHLHQLHATTALHQLAQSWPLLRRNATAALLQAPDGLRSTTYGTRHPTGGHTDGTASALLAQSADAGHWSRLSDQVSDQVAQACWLVRSAQPGPRPRSTGYAGPAAALRYLHAAIPALDQVTARDVAGYLADADRTARRALAIPAPRAPLTGVDCPACKIRMLEVCTAAPEPAAWTVVCAAGCRCTGTFGYPAALGYGCPCGMGERIEGAAHIWLRSTVLAGVTGGLRAVDAYRAAQAAAVLAAAPVAA